MIIATATASASSAFHQTAACSQAAPPVPAITGAMALGRVRGRAPAIHCAKLATRRSFHAPCTTMAYMLGVIGGSGFYTFFDSDARTVNLDTPYGEPSAPVTVGTVGQHEVAFLPRHGANHEFSGAQRAVSGQHVGAARVGRAADLRPVRGRQPDARIRTGRDVVPDQLVDRTRRRADTYFDSGAATSCSPTRTARRCGPRSPDYPAWSTAAPWWSSKVRDFPPAPKASGSPPRASP